MDNITLRPHWMQYALCEMPLIMLSFIAAGITIYFYDSKYEKYMELITLFIWVILLYRILYIRRIKYIITDQQILYQHGIITYTTDYLELYRVFDYQQARSPMQQLVGLKTIYIMVADRNTPVLEMIGIENKNNIITVIRDRVEYNKATDIKRIALAVAMLCATVQATAQATEENPSDWVVIQIGRDSLSAVYSKEITEMGKITGLQATMYVCLTQIKKYNREYSDYLSNVTPFLKNANLVKNLYGQGAILIRNTMLLTKIIQKRPVGIATSVSISNIYVELAVEVYKTYSTFKDIITKGGPDNKLNAKERVEMLWLLSDNIRMLNDKIRRLTFLIAVTDWEDVWEYYTEGLVPRDARQIARLALSRWQRAYKAQTMIMEASR